MTRHRFHLRPILVVAIVAPVLVAGGFLLMPADEAPATTLDVPLPFSGTVTSSVPGFEVKQDGGGIAGRFEIRNEFSSAIALDGVSRGTGHALLAWNLGLGRGAVSSPPTQPTASPRSM